MNTNELNSTSISNITKNDMSLSMKSKSEIDLSAYKKKKELDKIMPDFYKIQERHMKGVLRGRHPSSYHKNSELWHYFKASNERVKSIKLGKSITTIIEDESKKYDLLDRNKDDDISIKSHNNTSIQQSNQPINHLTNQPTNQILKPKPLESNTKVHSSNESIHTSHTSQDESNDTINSINFYNPKRMNIFNPLTNKSKSNLFNNNKQRLQTINDITIDLSTSSTLTYGSIVIIKNFNDEILCINEFNEIRCKSVYDIQSSDRLCFRLIDLSDLYNGSSIFYGDNIWLQAIDTNNRVKNNANVVAAKVYQPADMNSMQSAMNNTIKSDNKSNKNIDSSLDNITDTKLDSKIDSKIDSNLDGDTDSPTNNPLDNPSNSDICGRAFLLPIVDNTGIENAADIPMNLPNFIPYSSQSKNKRNSQVSFVALENIEINKYNSRFSSTLGKWVVNSGVRSDHIAMNDNSLNYNNNINKSKPFKLKSNEYIYIEQDLYCLSTTNIPNFNYWPKISLDFISNPEMFISNKYKYYDMSSVTNSQISSNSSGDKSVRPSTKDGLLKVLSNENFNTRMKIIQSGKVDVTTSHICLRKINLKKEKTSTSKPINKHTANTQNNESSNNIDNYIIDRKNLWKFFTVEKNNFSSTNKKLTNLPNQLEKLNYELLDKAKSNMKKSENLRKGAKDRLYHDDIYLPSGELFIKSLLSVSLENVYNHEIDILEQRRTKENHIKEHFENLLDKSVPLTNKPTSSNITNRPFSENLSILSDDLNNSFFQTELNNNSTNRRFSELTTDSAINKNTNMNINKKSIYVSNELNSSSKSINTINNTSVQSVGLLADQDSKRTAGETLTLIHRALNNTTIKTEAKVEIDIQTSKPIHLVPPNSRSSNKSLVNTSTQLATASNSPSNLLSNSLSSSLANSPRKQASMKRLPSVGSILPSTNSMLSPLVRSNSPYRLKRQLTFKDTMADSIMKRIENEDKMIAMGLYHKDRLDRFVHMAEMLDELARV